MAYTYIIRRDGQELHRTEVEVEVLEFMHRNSSQSMSWAVKHEGYTIVVQTPDGNEENYLDS